MAGGDGGTVVLLRHGQTPWNRDGRIQGWAPVGLTDRGRAQARRAGRYLADTYDVDRVVASDLQRTRETAAVLAGHVGASVSFAAGWRERGFGVLQGLDYDDLFERFPEYSVLRSGRAAAGRRPEAGESLLETRARVLEAWRRLRADLGDGTVLVVTHGGPIYVVLAELRDVALPAAIADLEVDNCGITEVSVAGDAATVVRENHTGWRS